LPAMKDFLSRLVQAETTTATGELPGAEVVAAELSRSGIEAVVDTWDRTRANVSARVKSCGDRGGLLFA